MQILVMSSGLASLPSKCTVIYVWLTGDENLARETVLDDEVFAELLLQDDQLGHRLVARRDTDGGVDSPVELLLLGVLPDVVEHDLLVEAGIGLYYFTGSLQLEGYLHSTADTLLNNHRGTAPEEGTRKRTTL